MWCSIASEQGVPNTLHDLLPGVYPNEALTKRVAIVHWTRFLETSELAVRIAVQGAPPGSQAYLTHKPFADLAIKPSQTSIACAINNDHFLYQLIVTNDHGDGKNKIPPSTRITPLLNKNNPTIPLQYINSYLSKTRKSTQYGFGSG